MHLSLDADHLHDMFGQAIVRDYSNSGAQRGASRQHVRIGDMSVSQALFPANLREGFRWLTYSKKLAMFREAVGRRAVYGVQVDKINLERPTNQ